MKPHKRSKIMCPLLFLIVVTVLLKAPLIKAGQFPASGSVNSEALLKCGYIRRNIANTLFHPGFVMYLSGQEEKYTVLDERRIRNAVKIWNSLVADERKTIRYQSRHFRKLAGLSGSRDNIVSRDDLIILHAWMPGIDIEVVDGKAAETIHPQEMQRLNADGDKAIYRALEIIRHDPVGKRLIAHSASHGITIGAEPLHDHKGYFEYRSNAIVIDPTAASYIFKINGLVHELVHASNPDKNNSVFEETLAEIIGMAVQDRITGVHISCSPYVVFIDRLLDPLYGEYPLRNAIEKHLRQAGIVINYGRAAQ